MRRTMLFAIALLATGTGCSRSRASAGGPFAEAAARRYGDVMAEVGRRFERLGRAAQAGRWELAAYDAGELGEIFADDLPGATPPPEVRIALRPLATAFAERWPDELKRAVERREPAAFAATFAKVAEACNGCHQAAGHAFLVVPTSPGASVPDVAPLPAATRSAASVETR